MPCGAPRFPGVYLSVCLLGQQCYLAYSVLRVLRGETKAMTYSGKNVWQGFEGLDI